MIGESLNMTRLWKTVRVFYHTFERNDLVASPSVCVGKHVANNSMFIEIATCLWAFSFTNIEGQELNADTFHDEGIVVYVTLFSM